MVSKVLTRPNRMGTLRAMEIGEKREFKMEGNNVAAFHTARSKGKKRGLGEWEQTNDFDNNLIVIVRIK